MAMITVRPGSVEGWRDILFFHYQPEVRSLRSVSDFISIASDNAFQHRDRCFCYAPDGKQAEFKSALLTFISEFQEGSGVKGKGAFARLERVSDSKAFAVRCWAPEDEDSPPAASLRTPALHCCEFFSLGEFLLSDPGQGEIHQALVRMFAGIGPDTGRENVSDALLLRPNFFGVGVDLAKAYQLVKSQRQGRKAGDR